MYKSDPSFQVSGITYWLWPLLSLPVTSPALIILIPKRKNINPALTRHFSEPNNHSFIAAIQKKTPSVQLHLARSGKKSSQKSSRNTISNLAHEVFITEREHQQFGRSQNSLPTTQAIFNHNICPLWRKPPHPQHILTNYSICLVKSHLSFE